MFLLGIDTCGPSGSVALGRLTAMSNTETVAQKDLEGRTYSATLVTAIKELLAGQGIRLPDIGCIVVVNGPGSFTGVRVGLERCQGPGRRCGHSGRCGFPAGGAGAEGGCAFCGARCPPARSLSAYCRSRRAGNCWPAWKNWPESPLRRKSRSATMPLPDCCSRLGRRRSGAGGSAHRRPMRSPLPRRRIAAGNFDDVALLDGHYLRRSDAEIFGNTVGQS